MPVFKADGLTLPAGTHLFRVGLGLDRDKKYVLTFIQIQNEMRAWVGVRFGFEGIDRDFYEIGNGLTTPPSRTTSIPFGSFHWDGYVIGRGIKDIIIMFEGSENNDTAEYHGSIEEIP